MSGRSNIAMLLGATLVSAGAFWAATAPGVSQEAVFASDLAFNAIEPITCPAEPMNVLIGQPVADVDLETLPQPFEVYAHDGEPRGEYRAERLLIRFDANGTVTNVTCG
ncbi:hypothetical protein [Hyphobacterium sp.]|uniref:hypothetical protein n=1 Tax=Hyphobacterium sp. TaxID=2004662 RepID=UPI003BAD5CA8